MSREGVDVDGESSMTSAEGQVSLSDFRVESRTSMDAIGSARYTPTAPMRTTRTRR
jgi:hypothetical protein